MKKRKRIAEILYRLPPLAVILCNTLFLAAAGFGIAVLYERITGGGIDAAGTAGIWGLTGFFVSVLLLMRKGNAEG